MSKLFYLFSIWGRGIESISSDTTWFRPDQLDDGSILLCPHIMRPIWRWGVVTLLLLHWRYTEMAFWSGKLEGLSPLSKSGKFWFREFESTCLLQFSVRWWCGFISGAYSLWEVRGDGFGLLLVTYVYQVVSRGGRTLWSSNFHCDESVCSHGCRFSVSRFKIRVCW